MERDCKNLNKIWPDLKQLAQFGEMLALLMRYVQVGIKKTKKKKQNKNNFLFFLGLEKIQTLDHKPK